MDIQKILYVLRAIGISGILRTIQNGFLRDRIEKQYSLTSKSVPPHAPGKQLDTLPVPGGLKINYENASVELVFLTPNMIRTSWEPGLPPVPYTLAKTDWEIQAVTIQQDPSYWSVVCGEIEGRIAESGGITILDRKGSILRIDYPPDKVGDRWRLSTKLTPEECIYGLGERASTLNLRPGTYLSWNTDAEGSYGSRRDPLYNGTPVNLSLSRQGSYLCYFENSFQSTFNLTDTVEAVFSGGMLRYYLIFGPIHEIYAQLSQLLGRAPLPPRWSLGYHQCRWGYKTEADIRVVAQGFRQHNLPISAIHLDIDYMDKFRLFTFSPSGFTDIRQLSADMDAQGIKLVTSINPAVKTDQKYPVYRDGIKRDAFCKLPDHKLMHGVSWPGWSVFPDFTNPNVRKWWQEQYRSLVDNGISGIWHDMNEPSSFTAWGDKTIPINTLHEMDGRGGTHIEGHNIYGLLMNMSGYEGLRKIAPNRRPWILSRAGWAGSQRYAWNWTGDVETSWQALRQTIPTILGLGLSGHPYSGVDIGGFSGSPNAELYLRWFQLASFLPFFRTHSAVGTKPREPWTFGEKITNIIRQFLQLRYELLPYWYSLAWLTSQTGYPTLRPIFWENPNDEGFWNIDDEFLVGDALLIAPILEENANMRRITFPTGNWYAYWDDREYDGPLVINYPASLETIPIFVKGGAILPFEQDGKLTLNIYHAPESQTYSRLYSDSGDGYGAYRVETFHMDSLQNKIGILWTTTGEFPFNYSSIKIKLHGKQISHAECDSNLCEIDNNSIEVPEFRKLFLQIT